MALKDFYDNIPTLKSDRLILRPIVSDDAYNWAEFTSDSDIYINVGVKTQTAAK